MMRTTYFIALLCAFCTSQAETLQHDPFARPLLTARTDTAAANTGATTVATNSDPVSTWNPKLTAIMVAGKHSLVNLEGKLIRIGEESDGYRLVQVKDGEAIFKKDNQRVVLRMENQAPAENKRLR